MVALTEDLFKKYVSIYFVGSLKKELEKFCEMEFTK